MSSSASPPDIRKFNTYNADELTLEQARQHRDALLHEMDTIVSFAQNYTKDEAMFPTLREKFIRCKKEEKLYRKYSYKLFLSQPSNTYHSSNNGNYNENKMNNTNENLQLPDIPDDGNKNNSVVDYHSAEEKKCELDANAYTHGTNGDDPKAKQHRLSPPRKAHKTQNPQKTHKPRPYIDDQNGQKHATSSDEQYTNVAYLLFTEWPHPINTGDLYPKYYNHFRAPLELSDDNIIESNPLKWISKRENPYFALYGLDDAAYSKTWDEKYYFWEIVDILGFFNSYDRKHQEVLIREKVHKTFTGLHPEGLKSDQVEKLFRYCIGLQVNELSNKMYDDIHNYVFKKYRHGNDGEEYIRLCKDEPSFPLREPWKVYSLSVKHQMICILTEQGADKLSVKELGVEFQSKFGEALDMKSWWIQSNLDKLIDSDLFKREKVLKISEEGRRKHKAWIEWWDCNGPAAEHNNVSAPSQKQVVHNAEAHSLQSPHRNQKQKQSQSYNDVRKYEESDYNYNQNQNEMNSENQYGSQYNRRPGHDPETLLYIRGFTQDMNIKQILSEIEQEYKIKFANFRPPAIRWNGNMASVAPIPVQTIEMATRLISQHPLRTKSMQKANRLDVRKYETTGNRYNGNGNNNGYERNSNNNNYGGYGIRNNGRNNHRQFGCDRNKWQGNQ